MLVLKQEKLIKKNENNGSVKVSKPNNIKTGIYSVKNNAYIHKTQPNPIKNIGKAIIIYSMNQ